MPPLAEKKVNFSFDKLAVDKVDPVFLHKRMAALSVFLWRVASEPTLSRAPVLEHFLGTPAGWREHLTFTKDGQTVRWKPPSLEGLKKLLVSTAKPDRRFAEVKAYSTALQDGLSSVLSAHAEIGARTDALLSTYNAFGEGLTQLAQHPACEGQGAELNAVAEAFDSMADEGTRLIKREDLGFADPVKEYVFFADSLRRLCDNQERLQSEFESTAAAAEAKGKEAVRTQKQEGIGGFFSSLTSGGNQEAIQRKVTELRAQEEALRTKRAAAEAACVDFNDAALANVAKFHSSKESDLKGYVVDYAKIRREWCAKQLEQYRAIVEACDAADAGGG